jgi:hypothetical protein
MDTAPELLQEGEKRLMGESGDDYCAFHARNPVTGKLAYCMNALEAEVIIPMTMANGRFSGDGVLAAVCAEHLGHLVETYGAVAVSEKDEA